MRLQGALAAFFCASGEFECEAGGFASAAVDDGYKDAPAVFATMDGGQIGGPTLIGMIGDGG